MGINYKRLINIAYNVALEETDKQFNHVSLITDYRAREIHSVGVNSSKTHPLNIRFGYPYQQIHSECHALSKLPRFISIECCILVNFRFNKKMQLRMSKPCKYCLPWCVNFRSIYYSNNAGIIEKL